MALHPLPPSSNESVIDNGSNVWQMAVHMILVLSHNLPKQCRLSHAGMLPWRSRQHPLRNEQEDNLEQSNKNTISTFFPFLHGQKQAAGVVLKCRTGVSACHCLQPGLQKPINICDESIDCSRMHAPSAFFAWTCLRSRNDLRHFIGHLLLSASAAARSVDGRAFFFFFTVDRTTNRVQTPSLPYESSFVCPRCVNFWDDSLPSKSWLFRMACFVCNPMGKTALSPLRQDPPPWFEFLVIFDFFAPWYRRGWEASSVKILEKNPKEKLVKCATEVARLHRVSIQSCTQNRPSPKVQSLSRDWI